MTMQDTEVADEGSIHAYRQAGVAETGPMATPVTPTSHREDDSERDPKRRKLRKGTHSCWGCKRRKVRCTFATLPSGRSSGEAPADGDLQGTVCDGCRRRGIACISQDVPEALAQETPVQYQRHQADNDEPRQQLDNHTPADARLDRVEALVEALFKKLDDRRTSEVPATARSRGSSREATPRQRTAVEVHDGDSVADEDVAQAYRSWPNADKTASRQPSGLGELQEHSPRVSSSTAQLGLPTPAESSGSSVEAERPTYTTWFGHQRVIEDEVSQSAAVPSATPAATTVDCSTACSSETVLGASPAGMTATPGVTGISSSSANYAANKLYMDRYNGLMAAWPSQDDLQTLVHILSATNKRRGRLAVIGGPTSTVLAANNPPVNLKDVRDLLVVPPAGTHLALIALKLLMIALSLQHLDAADPADLDDRHGDRFPGAETPALAARLHVSPQQLMQTAVDAANTLVVSQECLIGSLEGVHCLVLVGIYQANVGNLRRAWLAMRRAMTVAQLMGMQRSGGDISGSSGSWGTNGGSMTPALACLDLATRDLLPPRCLWFRIVFADRYLSLMLGLPQGVPGDQAVTSSSRGRQRGKMMETLAQPVFGTDTEEARALSAYVAEARQRLWQIEYRHAIIAGRILERNEAWRGEDEEGRDAWDGAEDGDGPDEDDEADADDDDDADDTLHAAAARDHSRLSTEAIDWALQRASRSMPAQWWQTPRADEWEARDGAFAFLVTQRVVDQLFHYHLLAQLHLPFMLRRAGKKRGERQPDTSADGYAYSKITCASASREVLTRFLALRGLRGRTVSCRSVDFFALLASTTLCLAHLDSHGNSEGRSSSSSRNVSRTRRSRSGPHPTNTGLPSFLAHQRHGDRGMMERVLETMGAHARAHPHDALTHKSVAFLRRLLAIEEAASLVSAAAMGSDNRAVAKRPRSSNSHAVVSSPAEEAMSIWVPYLGTIRISRGGIVRVRHGPEASGSAGGNADHPAPRDTAHAAASSGRPPSTDQAPVRSVRQQPSLLHCGPAPVLPSNGAPAVPQNDRQTTGLSSPYNTSGLVRNPSVYPETGGTGVWTGETNSSIFPVDPYFPAVSSDNYTLEGVDFAFFENLLMHSSLDDLASFEPTPALPMETGAS